MKNERREKRENDSRSVVGLRSVRVFYVVFSSLFSRFGKLFSSPGIFVCGETGTEKQKTKIIS
jgi:hypothetical protein